MNPSIAAQAAKSATQGQNMLNDYTNKGNSYQGQYNDFSNQATDANQAVKNQTTYMQGEGNAGNQYNTALTKQLGDLGYDQSQMTAARGNLNQAQGSLSAYSDFANQAASKWGLNAGGFAAANSGALSGINNNIAAQQGVVNNLHDIYKTGQAGANQYAGLQVQGQHETMAGLQNVFTNASNQRDNAGSMMNFYHQMAQQQGGLNAQQAKGYADAQQAYAGAQQALAQASYLGSQTAGQNLKNQYDINTQNSAAYKSQLAGKTNAQGNQVNSKGNPVVSPTADQLNQLNINQRKAQQYNKDVSGWDRGLSKMDLMSIFQGHR